MRVIIRFFSLLSLVAAVITGSLDVIQSFAASSVVLTQLGPVWQSLQPAGPEALSAFLASLPLSVTWLKLLDIALDQPVSVLCLVLSLLLWMIAYRRPQPGLRFAA